MIYKSGTRIDTDHISFCSCCLTNLYSIPIGKWPPDGMVPPILDHMDPGRDIGNRILECLGRAWGMVRVLLHSNRSKAVRTYNNVCQKLYILLLGNKNKIATKTTMRTLRYVTYIHTFLSLSLSLLILIVYKLLDAYSYALCICVMHIFRGF